MSIMLLVIFCILMLTILYICSGVFRDITLDYITSSPTGEDILKKIIPTILVLLSILSISYLYIKYEGKISDLFNTKKVLVQKPIL